MADSARARRLAKRIVAIVATELEHTVKDPRLAMVTITAATLTPDLREAVVYYTVYGSDREVEESSMALASATGVLRSAVGRQTGIKFTPTLAFRMDTVPENADRINELLAAARALDAAVAERAAGASYAGEPDPYRVPRDLADDELADEDFDGDPVDDAATGGAADADDDDDGDGDGDGDENLADVRSDGAPSAVTHSEVLPVGSGPAGTPGPPRSGAGTGR